MDNDTKIGTSIKFDLDKADLVGESSTVISAEDEYFCDPDIEDLLLDTDHSVCKYVILLTGFDETQTEELSHNFVGIYEDADTAVETAKLLSETSPLDTFAKLANALWGRFTVEEMIIYGSGEEEYIGTIYKSDILSLLHN